MSMSEMVEVFPGTLARVNLSSLDYLIMSFY